VFGAVFTPARAYLPADLSVGVNEIACMYFRARFLAPIVRTAAACVVVIAKTVPGARLHCLSTLLWLLSASLR
jgi:hypothetical protein